jgi:hypothetical protein
MTNSTLKQLRKRKLFALVALLPLASGCSKAAQGGVPDDEQRRFKNMGLVLVIDAVAGAEMEGVVILDDLGYEIFGRGRVSRRNRSIMALGSSHVPLTVHAVWRKGAGWDKARGIWNEGAIAGDYTIPVAKRIPDERNPCAPRKSAPEIPFEAGWGIVRLGYRTRCPVGGRFDFRNARWRFP